MITKKNNKLDALFLPILVSVSVLLIAYIPPAKQKKNIQVKQATSSPKWQVETQQIEDAKFNKEIETIKKEIMRTKKYPVNKKGETYGPDLSDIMGKMPDLVPAQNPDGKNGYVKFSEANYIEVKPDQMLTEYLYDKEGKKIGVFQTYYGK